MNIQEGYSDVNLLNLNDKTTAKDYAIHALALYRIGEEDNIKQAQMLWEYAKEYMLLSAKSNA